MIILENIKEMLTIKVKQKSGENPKQKHSFSSSSFSEMTSKDNSNLIPPNVKY